jgi:hypothetical protein
VRGIELLGERAIRGVNQGMGSWVPHLVSVAGRFDATVDRQVGRVLKEGRQLGRDLADRLPSPPSQSEPPREIAEEVDLSVAWPDPSESLPPDRLPVLELFGLAEPEVHYPPSAVSVGTAPARHVSPHQNGIALRPRPSELWEHLPRLADLTEEDEDEVDTGRLIQRLWDAGTSEDEAPAGEWEPERFSRTAISGRSFRWSVLLVAVLLAVGAVALLLAATGIPQSRAAEVASRYHQSSGRLEDVLPDARQAASLVADPESDLTVLAEAAVPLARLKTRSLELSTLASQPLPNSPPLASRQPIETLVPARDRLQQAAEAAEATQGLLGNVLDHRLLVARTFQLPPLPVSASPGQIGDLGVELAITLADTLDVIAQLPDEPVLAAHRHGLEGLAERFEAWQATYLDALRREDVEEATRLVEELQQAVAFVRADLAEPLSSVEQGAQQQFDQIEVLLGEAQATLRSGEAPP